MTVIVTQVIFIIASIAMMILILLQQSKGAGLGASFGSGASATVFGARGSGSFLYKTTRLLALVFFLSALALGYFQNKVAHESGFIATQASVEKKVEAKVDVPAPSADNGAPASNTEVPKPAK